MSDESAQYDKAYLSSTQLLNKIWEVQKITEFDKPWIQSNKDTIPYILAIDNHIRINKIIDPQVKFSVVYKTIPPVYQTIFSTFAEQQAEKEAKENNNNNKQASKPTQEQIQKQYNVKTLKKWIATTYPPPITRDEIVKKLSKLLYKKNEDPTIVYGRYLTQLKKINECIKLINTTIETDVNKLPEVTDLEQFNALRDIFVSRNNNRKFGNDGQINKTIEKAVLKHNPQNVKAFLDFIPTLREKARPRVLANNSNHQFQIHDVTAGELDIYYTPKSSRKFRKNNPNKNYQNRNKRSRPFNNFVPYNDNNENQPRKKTRHPKHCTFCKMNNHNTDECFKRNSKNYKNNNRNNYKNNKSNHSQHKSSKCYRCHKIGHKAKNCWATTDASGNPLMKNHKETNKKFSVYNPTKHPENQRALSELKQEQYNRNRNRKLNKNQQQVLTTMRNDREALFQAKQIIDEQIKAINDYQSPRRQ